MKTKKEMYEFKGGLEVWMVVFFGLVVLFAIQLSWLIILPLMGLLINGLFYYKIRGDINGKR